MIAQRSTVMGEDGQNIKLATCLHLLLTLRMCGRLQNWHIYGKLLKTLINFNSC